MPGSPRSHSDFSRKCGAITSKTSMRFGSKSAIVGGIVKAEPLDDDYEARWKLEMFKGKAKEVSEQNRGMIIDVELEPGSESEEEVDVIGNNDSI